MREGGEEALEAFLGYALATIVGVMVGAHAGRAVVALAIVQRNRNDPNAGRVVVQARLALGLLLAWMIYLLVHIFIA